MEKLVDLDKLCSFRTLSVVLILNLLFQVETVEGVRNLKIPSGIQHGHSVKLSRLGVPDRNKPSIRGDHYFVVIVLIPKDIRSVFFSYHLYCFLICLIKLKWFHSFFSNPCSSDTERALLEKLASLRASRKGSSFSSDDSGNSSFYLVDIIG